MPDLGFYLLLIGFLLAAHALAASLLGGWRRRPELVASGKRALVALAVALALSSAALVSALVTRDFSVAYVARHTDSHLPMFYTVSAFWAGQEGSLLFWALVLAVASALAVRFNLRGLGPATPYVVATLAGVNLFFAVLLVFAANPFERLLVTAAEGSGLNPLLRNPGMVFHPPLVLAGYATFAIPFAFAIGSMASRRLDTSWIRATRRWTLSAWFSLTAGILLGAEWAYKVLGWGGYWAWDPVENASLLPWLTATAYLHSVMIQEKKGMLKIWNLVLIILTFELAVFGTFLTRSGILSSVHSFSGSSLGPMFFGFLLATAALSFGLLWRRRTLLRSENRLEAVLSRESSFLFNNLVLVALAFAVLTGTMFPLISEYVTGEKISVGPPYYNKVAAPFGLALLALTGICPLISWRKATWRNFRNNFLWPLAATAAGTGLLYAAGVGRPLALGLLAACLFVLIVTGLEFARGARARSRMAGEPLPTALRKLIAKNPRRYGGFVIHAGTALLFVGVVGSSFYQTTVDGVVAPGGSLQAGKYTVVFQGLEPAREASRESVYANLELRENGAFRGVLRPAKHYYPTSDQPATSVAIRTSPVEDVYVILQGWERNGAARLRVMVNPLTLWIWAGGGLMLLGTLVVIWPEPKRAPVAVEVPEEVVCDAA